jgi:uncharacterized protein YfaQ (DUF2300 family)
MRLPYEPARVSSPVGFDPPARCETCFACNGAALLRRRSVPCMRTRLRSKCTDVVPLSSAPVTSRQPTRQSLERLAARGFKVVIYLALPTVSQPLQIMLSESNACQTLACRAVGLLG